MAGIRDAVIQDGPNKGRTLEEVMFAHWVIERGPDKGKTVRQVAAERLRRLGAQDEQ
jgi:hypothetical protein